MCHIYGPQNVVVYIWRTVAVGNIAYVCENYTYYREVSTLDLRLGIYVILVAHIWYGKIAELVLKKSTSLRQNSILL